MFRAPACIDALEARLNTSVEYFHVQGDTRRVYRVQAKCTSAEGLGYTLEDAVHDLLVQMELEP